MPAKGSVAAVLVPGLVADVRVAVAMVVVVTGALVTAEEVV
ncbi:hypothetical protein [Umezawaea sp.]